MTLFSVEKYDSAILAAVKQYWQICNKQQSSSTADTTKRASKLGAKQLDGFIDLLMQLSLDLGIPENCLHSSGSNYLPGFFRPSKNWDFLVITPAGKLVAVVELKSQGGAYRNNFNNRTEEALGNAVDLWTAYREKSFPEQAQPWVGYLLLVSQSQSPKENAKSPVRVNQPFFKVRPEFQDTSYLQRYHLFCEKLVLERHYSSAALIWSESEDHWDSLDELTSIRNFLSQYAGHVIGQMGQFNS